MLESLPFRVILGAALGFLSGLGVGGGTLLVLWLTAAEGTAPETARTVNLLFFLPAAAVALWFRRKQDTLTFRPLLPAIVAGCCSAALCSRFSAALDTQLLKKGFGILLIVTGLREIVYKKKKAS